MMKLFVVYAKIDKAYCLDVMRLLQNTHDVFYDLRLYTGPGWWESIVFRLNWAEAIIYLISKESLESQYCNDEIAIAKRRGLPIFPVLVNDVDEPTIPAEFRETQYADLRYGLTWEAVQPLMEGLIMAERQQLAKTQLTPKVATPPQQRVSTAEKDVRQVYKDALEAVQKSEFDKAVHMLRQAIDQGVQTNFVRLEELLQLAEEGLAQQMTLREAKLTFDSEIAPLLRAPRTRSLGCRKLLEFHGKFPEYDLQTVFDSLGGFDNVQALARQGSTEVSSRQSQEVRRARPAFQLPLFELVPIPAGDLQVPRVDAKGKMTGEWYTIPVPAFKITRYPITNRQYSYFLRDPHGYSNVRWWDYSNEAREWRRLNDTPARSGFEGDLRPRENVSWFDAVAMSLWLGARMDLKIILPSRMQWQRAARGDERRLFPTGDTLTLDQANTAATRLHQTTPVNRYERCASPFGVVDLAGNCWEWLLDNEHAQIGVGAKGARTVQGGSFMSNIDRAKIDYGMLLKPDSSAPSIGFRVVCLP